MSVSNIQTNATESEIKELLSCVGPILYYKEDRGVGSVKLSAQVEYADEQTAKAAVRHLNGYKF